MALCVIACQLKDAQRVVSFCRLPKSRRSGAGETPALDHGTRGRRNLRLTTIGERQPTPLNFAREHLENCIVLPTLRGAKGRNLAGEARALRDPSSPAPCAGRSGAAAPRNDRLDGIFSILLFQIFNKVLRASTSSIVLTIILRKSPRGSSESKRSRSSCGLSEPRINNGRLACCTF